MLFMCIQDYFQKNKACKRKFGKHLLECKRLFALVKNQKKVIQHPFMKAEW